MNTKYDRELSPQVQDLIDEFLPIIRTWEVGRSAISIGGSLGRGTWDSRSDVDFRLFHERDFPTASQNPDMHVEFNGAVERWQARGIRIDGIWPRRIDHIDAALDRWLNGEIQSDDRVWCVWGYHLLSDIYHQVDIEDPYGIIAGWKERLSHYPPKLREALLAKHLAALRYWRNDYHYENKVRRGDMVFLAGLTAKLVHNMMQVLFALNEAYFVGDGQNLEYVQRFRHKPTDFSERVRNLLYPGQQEEMLEAQYAAATGLIDDILQLTAQVEAQEKQP